VIIKKGVVDRSRGQDRLLKEDYERVKVRTPWILLSRLMIDKSKKRLYYCEAYLCPPREKG